MFIPQLPAKWWVRVVLLGIAGLLISLLLWTTVVRVAAVLGVPPTTRQSFLAPLVLLIFLPFLLWLVFQIRNKEHDPGRSTSITATPSLRIPFQKPHLAAAMLDSTEALIILLDPQGRIVRCNRACAYLTGYTTDELAGHTFWDILLPPNEQEHVQAMLTRGNLTRFPFQQQQTWVTRTGQQHQVAVTTSVLMEPPGQLTHLVVTGVNITEQKHAERALQCEQHLLSQIMEVNPNGIIVVDQQGQIIFANARAADLLGRSQDEILRHTYNDPVWKITDVDSTPLPDEALPFRQVMQTGRMIFGSRLALERAAGQRIMLSISGAPLTNLEGAISSVVFAFTDITQTVALEQKLRQARDTMEQQVEERTRELEQLTEELLTLSTLSEFLQRCHTIAEAFAVIARFAHRLFPEDAGVMSARRSLRPELEPVISWGGLTAAHAVTDPEMCWALTCGKVHLAENPDTDLFCTHTQQEPIGPHLCIPFFVQNEVCGVLHLRLAPPAENDPQEEWSRHCAAKQRLGTALAEQVSLALSNILLREQLHQQAVRDPLTGLYNRRMMDEALNREIRRAGRTGRTLGIILFDIDHFKRFNDTYGHPAGDTLLVAVSELLRMLFRAEDILCRYGGEEFLIILPEASLPNAIMRAEELRREASQMQVRHQDQDLPAVTISLGVAAFPVHGTTGHALVQRADAALYQAKMDGRNQVVVSPTGLLFTEEQC